VIDKKLMEQLALAKEAGLKGMSKEFFAPTPGSGEGDEAQPGAQEPDGDEAASGGAGPGHVEMSADNITPEQLQELMRALGIEGGGQ